MSDPYYRTAEWRALRLLCLERDGYRCYVPGCHDRANTADHIKSRRQGGADSLTNLRSVCPTHDAQTKEGANGIRRSGGRAYIKGCDAQGWPLDPMRSR